MTHHAVLAAPLLLWAAVRDLWHRKVDNRLVVILGVLWFAIAVGDIFRDGVWSQQLLKQAVQTILGAGAVLTIGFFLFRKGYVGAGDVKLTAVMCLWVGAPRQVPFILATSLFGGVLVVAMPVLDEVETALASLWVAWTSRLPALGGLPPPHRLSARPCAGLPYALAIAAGALATLNTM